MDTHINFKLSRLLARRARENQFSGVVLLRQGDTDLFRRAYGYASRPWKIKNTPATRFRIASVGKLFTAAAVMQLLEAGKLSLETRVVEALGLRDTRIPPAATVYHLLTMTSGMGDWTEEDSENFEAEWAQLCREHPLYLLRSNADYLPIFAPLEPHFPVGERHLYNGAGFILLGLLIEKLSGMSYVDYVRQNIFARAGMHDSDFLDLDEVVPNVAEGYFPVLDENELVSGWKKNIYATTAGPAADGGMTSTADDLARFTCALRYGRLVSPALAQTMLAPKVSLGEQDESGYQWMYGFGCFVLLDQNGEIVRWGHTGEEEGVSCRLYYYPKYDLDVAILGNQSSCAGKLGLDIQELILS